MNKENTFTDNVEEGLLVSPEERPKRVSLLALEEGEISKKTRNNNKKKKQPLQQNVQPTPSLLIAKTSVSSESDQEESDNEGEDLDKLRQELQKMRNKLAAKGIWLFF